MQTESVNRAVCVCVSACVCRDHRRVLDGGELESQSDPILLWVGARGQSFVLSAETLFYTATLAHAGEHGGSSGVLLCAAGCCSRCFSQINTSE